MIGLLLVLTATFFREIGSSIGKVKVRSHKESIYTMGFLSLFWGTIILIATGFMKDSFVFTVASLPTFGARIFLEIAQIHVAILAITKADRSTFGFLRIITIPLLLMADIALGYTVTSLQIAGIGVIVLSLVILFINHGIRKKGAWLVLFTAINAPITISLYKYDITNFNSVEAEQGLLYLILMAYFFFMAYFITKENPILFLRKPIFFLQSLATGLGFVILSFAYLLAPASIIATSNRSFSILWTMISGNIYFHEKHFLVKLFAFILIVIGLVLLVM